VYCRNHAALGSQISAIALLLISPSCAPRPAANAPTRLAILRFENLGSDPSTDWMGRALSEVMTAGLAGAPGVVPISSGTLYSASTRFAARPVSAPGISSERELALAAGATRLGYGYYTVRGGRIEARFEVEDLPAHKITTAVSDVKEAGDLLALAASLAHPLSDRLTPFGVSNQQALEAWSKAVETTDLSASMALLERAIAADPNFGYAYRALAEREARQDRAQAAATLERGLARGSKISDRERLRMEFTLATVRDDPAAKERAITRLVELEPREPSHWSSLSEIAMNRRDYRTAASALQKFVELEPQNGGAWNQLGYAAAYAGDVSSAEGALHRYEALSPADPNPLDSLGDANLVNGRLREAEEYYLRAIKKQPGFLNHADLYKAAMARLMTGDVAGADGLARQYADARAASHDAAVDQFRAEWLWIIGRRAEGQRRLLEFARAAGTADAAARACAESAIWSLLLGDRSAAATSAAHAATLAATPPSRTLAALARFLSQPQAGAGATQGSAPDLPLTYALLLASDFKSAAAPVERIRKRTAPTSEEHSDVLMAWVLIETGRPADALPLLRANIIPSVAGPSPLLSFVFPRIYYLRAVAAEKAGHPDEARSNYRLFQQLSGDQPLIWGEEKTAAANLSRTPPE